MRLTAGFGRLLLAFFLTCAPAAAQTGMAIDRNGAEAAFGMALLFPCLTHVERGVLISTLPDNYRRGVVAAPESAARLSAFKGVTGVWADERLGTHLMVGEIGPDKCVIVADQLPVEETLHRAADAATRLQPPFTAVPTRPGYWPVTYQLERIAGGKRITLLLQGAEPGAPGHASRFAILLATVTATPAPYVR